IGDAARDRGCDREMRKLLGVVAVDLSRLDALLLHHALQREVRSGAALAIDKAGTLGGDVLQSANAGGVASRDEQTLVAADEMNDTLRARLEPRLVLFQDFATECASGNVKARELAAVLAERHHAFETSDEAHIELRPRTRAQKFA